MRDNSLDYVIYYQLAVLETELSGLRQRLAELEVRERAVQEREEKVESLQQELADMREKLHGLEVRYMCTAELYNRACPVVCLSMKNIYYA